MLSKGQKINDRYEIVKSIGEGGMANVYLANDNILDRKVAVKVLRGDLSADDKFIRRFEREAQSVSNLSHQNIVEVYDVGVEDNEHYIVMEYIEGKTLKQLLKKRESLTLTEVIDIMTQLTQTNSVMGSVHYLPPEQASGKGATIKSDIYSLGILMYELITGNVPFKGDNAVEIALKHMKDKIPSIRKQNPATPQAVENILLKATAKNPRNRYDSVKQMHEDFLHCLEEEHANDKKVVFEYPENDLDSSEPISNKKKTTPKKVVEKPVTEDTDELVTEITDETNNDFEDIEEEINDDAIEEEEEEEEYFEEPKKRNTLITILASFFLLLLITGGVIWLALTQEVEDVTVPNIIGYTIDEAIEILENAGFTYTTEVANSDTIEEGKVIKSKPKAGSTRKKGDTITIVESIGGTYHYLENYVGLKYTEVKAKLELLGINVIVEKKDIEKKDDYKDKEDIIIDQKIDQKPQFSETGEKVIIVKGDTITLFIPNIINEYPDMVNEGWTLSDTIAFAKEYNLNLTVYDSTKNIIPKEEYNNYSNTKVISQERSVGDTIIEGFNFSININTQYKIEEPEAPSTEAAE